MSAPVLLNLLNLFHSKFNKFDNIRIHHEIEGGIE